MGSYPDGAEASCRQCCGFVIWDLGFRLAVNTLGRKEIAGASGHQIRLDCNSKPSKIADWISSSLANYNSCRVRDRFQIVEAQPRFWLDRERLFPGQGKKPSDDAPSAMIRDGVVTAEFADISRRSASGEIVRGSADRHALIGDAPLHQTRAIAQRSVADRQIESVLDQIHQPIAEVEIELELRVLLRQPGQNRSDAASAE
jgi:hypothetical protein